MVLVLAYPREQSGAARAEAEEACLPGKRALWQQKGLAMLVLFAASLLIIPGMLDEWDPLLLDSFEFTPTLIGVCLSLRFLLESLGAALAHRFDRLFRRYRAVVFVALALALALAVFAFWAGPVLLVLYAGIYLVWAIVQVQLERQLHRLAPRQLRATVLSWKSLVENVAAVGLMLLWGQLAQGFGLWTIWLFAAVWVALAALGFAFLVRKYPSF
jgi:hypothetical protein